MAFGAYISGSKSHDQRTGVSYNYSNKTEVTSSRILAPEGAPEWARHAHTLWNRVEQFEDDLATKRFAGHDNPEKNKRSLEAREKLISNAQTAQTIMCALPLELSPEQSEALVEEFLQARFVSRGLVVQYAIHDQKGNPHMHAQITRRALVGEQFSVLKDREITSKLELVKTRHAWADITNKHLALAGHQVRIDARSLADQGSLFRATHHEGWWAQRLAERGGYSRLVIDNEAIRQQNIQIMCERPEAIIHEVALKRTTFTRKHIEDEIIRRVGGDEHLYAILKTKVEGLEVSSELILKLTNSNIIYEGYSSGVQGLAAKLTDQLLADQSVAHEVGQNLDRQTIYTSTQYKQQEEAVLGMADRLNKKASKEILYWKIDGGIANLEGWISRFNGGPDFRFFPEQIKAIHHLCSGKDIRVLNGKAGTGKTTLLKAVAQIYENEGYRVMGTSFQGKVVEIMQQEIGIPCLTLDSLIHSWNKYEEKKNVVENGGLWGNPYLYAFSRMKELEKNKFTNKDVIIVDEANMIGGHLWEPFLKEASTAGAKVLIIQDPAQIKSRDPGDFGRLFAERYGCAETAHVVRQKVDWQRQCSVLLNDHRVLDGLQPYQEQGHIQWFENQTDAHRQMVKDYVSDRMVFDPFASRMALAYTNKEVFELNQMIRSELKAQGFLKQHFTVNGSEYSIGDVIRFTQNDHHERFVKSTNFWTNQNKGVKNGSLGTIIGFDPRHQQLKVDLQGAGERVVTFKVADYNHFTLGYAMGVHKSEGSTFDKTFVSPDAMMDPSTTLVAMTRHRQDLQIYANHEKFVDFKDLVDQLSYGGMRDTLADYQVSAEQRPYLDRVQNYKDLIAEVGTLREEMERTSQQNKADGPYDACQQLLEQKQETAKEILGDWDNHLPYVRLAGIRRDVLEVDAGVRTRLLSDLEQRASVHTQGYIDLVRQTRDLWGKISETHPGNLSTSHELYADYKDLKSERDFMASVLMENPRICRQFFKIEKAITETGEVYKDYWGEAHKSDEKVSFAGVKDHANAHYKEHTRNSYRDHLSPDQKASFDLVDSYLNARNSAATIYSELQKRQENGVQMSGSKLITQEEFKKYQEQRDELALKIVSPEVNVQAHLDHLKVDEDKLLDHAIGGETRELIKVYHDLYGKRNRGAQAICNTKPGHHKVRAEIAQQLLTQQSHDKSKHIIKEAGFDFNRLKFDVALYKGIQEGKIQASINPDDVYKRIKAYLEPSHEVARLFHVVLDKAKENNIEGEPMEIMNQSPMKQEWLRMIHLRNENAMLLAQNEPAMIAMASMRPGFERKLNDHIAKAQTMDQHLSGDTLNQRYSNTAEPTASFKAEVNSLTDDMLISRAATSFEDLFKNLRAENDPALKEKLIDKLDEKMKLLAKDPTIIQHIKAINEPLGTKLEDAHLKLQAIERQHSMQRSRGMEM